ncbi:MAG: diguanylate cyclase [bacterium]
MNEAKKSASILIVDDSEAIRVKIRKVLSSEKGLFESFYEAENGIDGYKKLLEHKIDLILCDVVMPQIDGFKLLLMVKGHPELRDIPIIMLTAEEEQEKKNLGLQKGASDYLTKPFDDFELLARVRLHLKLKLLQDELMEANKQLTHLSITDALTQVYNRRYLMKMMLNEISRSKRYRSDLSFLLLDIDNFKALNDTYGHQAGDQILIDICIRIGKTIRSTDILSRYGGEEFAVLLPQVPLTGAEKVAEKIRKEVAENPFQINEDKINVSLSCGISCFLEEKVDTIDTVIMEADRALYESKKNGKNRVTISKDCLESISVHEDEDKK